MRFQTIHDCPNYVIFDDGRVMNQVALTRIKISHDRHGYPIAKIMKDGKSVTKRVHRLLAEAFIPNPDNLPTVNHKDGNKSNNSLENLEWASYETNNKHAYAMGLNKQPRKPVNEKRILVTTVSGQLIGQFPSRKIASKKLGISETSIYFVTTGRYQSSKGLVFKYEEDVK